jgi:hypothetical protein
MAGDTRAIKTVLTYGARPEIVDRYDKLYTHYLEVLPTPTTILP